MKLFLPNVWYFWTVRAFFKSTIFVSIGRKKRIAEEINKVPDDKKEVVSAMLIGICQGVQIADQMQRATA